MPLLSRLSLRLRRRALRWYELALCTVLLAMGFAIFEAAGGTDAAESVQCGNIHSSTVVTAR
ncbi:MAG TPA: hypothetical protein VNB23_12340 [Ramlibacter sp.]|nr:hypothetical protein [Ramlibacter sp.]